MFFFEIARAVPCTHLRAHETKANLVCRLLLEKKKTKDETCETEGTSADHISDGCKCYGPWKAKNAFVAQK